MIPAKPIEKKYYIDVHDVDEADIYLVCQRFNVTNPAIFHAVKKLLVAGRRGYKDSVQDLKEAELAIHRAIELEEINGRSVC